MDDPFAAPSDEPGSAEESEGSPYPDVKATQSRVIEKALGLDSSKARMLVEAICALAKEEPYEEDEGPRGKGSALLIGLGKPRK